MLSRHLPYDELPDNWNSRATLRGRAYVAVTTHRPDIPVWVDGALRKAVHPDPQRRYAELSEFLFDLRHPNAQLTARVKKPFIERNPVMFWKVVAGLLVLSNILAWFR